MMIEFVVGDSIDVHEVTLIRVAPSVVTRIACGCSLFGWQKSLQRGARNTNDHWCHDRVQGSSHQHAKRDLV